mmetsp:Transcript_13737/g.31799  ORF Transcript_13737/g.31799 Transcript_13737/m.31799 type:complete len:248 (+) Transcript_13737:6710-7453(+)
MIPARDTVAGEASRKFSISNSRRMGGVSGMRSLDASVSILLSSITVFMDSIHSGSISPSRTMYSCGTVVMLAKSRKICDTRPSFHSRVDAWMYPYSSLRVTALGLSTCVVVFSLAMFCALARVLMMHDLPQPAGPSTNTDQRTSSSSRSCDTLRLNTSSGWMPSSRAALRMMSSKVASRLRGTSSSVLGNKSLSRPMKMPTSSATSLPRLKSRRARRSTLSSDRSLSWRRMPPATLSVVFTARSFQS